MLAEEGYDVVGQAGDGEKAVELAEELRPDLVILDVKMPVLDGIAAAERIAGAADRAGRHPHRVLASATWSSGRATRARWPTWSSRSPRPTWCRRSRWRSAGSPRSPRSSRRWPTSTERLETRKAVDRAKGVLQEELGLTEPEAFRWIQKTAMDLRLSMRQVAEGVVAHGVARHGARTAEHRDRPTGRLADRSDTRLLGHEMATSRHLVDPTH